MSPTDVDSDPRPDAGDPQPGAEGSPEAGSAPQEAVAPAPPGAPASLPVAPAAGEPPLDAEGYRQRLRLARELERQQDQLVEEARKLLDSAGEVRNRRDETFSTQLRNLLNVAGQTDSLEVVANFVRYQLGRSAGSRGVAVWNRQAGGTTFGEAVINALQGPVTEAARHALERAGLPLEGEAWVETRAKAARLFLGFLYRHYVYVRYQALQEQPRRGGGARGRS